MPTYCRPPAPYIINEAVPIYIPSISSFDAIKNDGITINGFESANRGTYATRHKFLCSFKDFLRMSCVEGVCHGT